MPRKKGLGKDRPVRTELRKFAGWFMFGAITTTILQLIYGPIGWNVLTMLAILTAYFAGRLVSEMGK